MPAGYPVFLKAVRLISTDLGFTILVQHALGVTTGVLLYLTARRLGVVRYVSLIPAALVLLSGDQIYLEHILMGDTFYLFSMVLALYIFVRALMAPGSKWLLVAAGLMSGLACLTRATALVLPIVMLGWLALTRVRGSRNPKLILRRLALFGAPVVLIVVGYLSVASAVGPYAGMFDMGGFDLYARVAPFADCSQFTPPPHTRVLCESDAASLRYGPEYYAWDPTSVVRRNFPLSPATSQTVGRFAAAAIIHQPFSYIRAVGLDLARYVDPSLGHLRGGFGETHSQLSFSDYQAPLEHRIAALFGTRYTGSSPPSTRWLGDLATAQEVLRVGPLVMLVLLTGVVSGLFVGRRRGPLTAVTVMTFLLFLAPVATFTYDVRYVVPPQAFLALAAALGVQAILDRVQCRTSSADGEGQTESQAVQPMAAG
jgi:4-amino-4-deoxy-L-arabinose transferase-like glycosyltransferase